MVCMLQGCTRQAALEYQDLPCTQIAHHEPESVCVHCYFVYDDDGDDGIYYCYVYCYY